MCPSINLLKTYKVYPSVLNLSYSKDKFFIYVYLDPFHEFQKPFSVKVQGTEYCFAYEPFYIGKGTNASGYRQNQHISAFLKDKETNRLKIEKFQEVKEHMVQSAAQHDISKPWNWKEFQENYIKILKTFDNPTDLLKFEMEIIQKIGTVYQHKGPLVNKITNAYRFEKLSAGKQPLI